MSDHAGPSDRPASPALGRSEPVGSRRWSTLSVSAAFVALCGLAPVALAVTPRDGEPIAVLRPRPTSLVPQSVATHESAILWMSSLGHVVLLRASTPNLIRDLYHEDAALILAAAQLAGCLLQGKHAPSSITGIR